jgi:hypothetical protein
VTPAGITRLPIPIDSATLLGAAKAAFRYVSVHTGLPALVVAAIAVVVGYKILKRTARFAIEVTVISLALAALLDRFAVELGWVHW